MNAARSLSVVASRWLFVSLDLREWAPFYQIGFGLFVLWISFRRPLVWRGGDPVENEKFVRTALRVLAAGLIVGGLVELYFH